jgi:hypothetical protein
MVGPSTRRALNERALRTADWIHHRAKYLEDEIEKQQNIKVCAEQMLRDNLTCGSITKDDGTTVMVTFKASDLINLIVQMYRVEAELRRFTESPRIKLRRI